MKFQSSALIGILCLLLSHTVVPAQTFKVMSFNIRYDNKYDGKDKWENRKTEMLTMLNYYSPEIIGIQEGLNRQVNYIKTQLKNYNFIGIGREDGIQRGEYAAIFYDTTKFTVITSGTFWLSETPEEVSKGWDASVERICTYGLFERKNTKEKFWMFNIHFDHKGEKAREMSSKLILKRIKTINKDKYPVILTGDFNSSPDSKPVQILIKKLNDGLTKSEKPFYGPVGTYNSFNNSKEITKRIDYIFVSDFNVIDYRHIDDKLKNNNCISDHYPVMATLKFIKK